MISLKRIMYCPSDPSGPTTGKDVEIAKFGIGRYETGLLPKPSGGYTQTFGKAMEEAVRLIQRREGFQVTGNIGNKMWGVIWPLLDAYRQMQYRNWSPPLTFEERAWIKLMAAMKSMDLHTPGYLLGGGHGIPLYEVSAYQRLDCSSSTSKALYEAGLFGSRVFAIVSGDFREWGEPGSGKYFTVYYHSGHVFIRLHKSIYWRFDTSPQGDHKSPKTGPHLRYLPRFTGGFAARHYPNM